MKISKMNKQIVMKLTEHSLLLLLRRWTLLLDNPGGFLLRHNEAKLSSVYTDRL